MSDKGNAPKPKSSITSLLSLGKSSSSSSDKPSTTPSKHVIPPLESSSCATKSKTPSTAPTKQTSSTSASSKPSLPLMPKTTPSLVKNMMGLKIPIVKPIPPKEGSSDTNNNATMAIVKQKGQDAVCPITQELLSSIPIDSRIYLPCTHQFKKDALIAYLKKGADTCPVCKYRLSDENISVLTGRKANNKVPSRSRRNLDDEEEDAERNGIDLNSDDDDDDDEEDDESVGSIEDFIADDDEIEYETKKRKKSKKSAEESEENSGNEEGEEEGNEEGEDNTAGEDTTTTPPKKQKIGAPVAINLVDDEEGSEEDGDFVPGELTESHSSDGTNSEGEEGSSDTESRDE